MGTRKRIFLRQGFRTPRSSAFPVNGRAVNWMRKNLVQGARSKVEEGEFGAANRTLLTLAVVTAIIVVIGLLGITLVALCDEDREDNWPSVRVQ